MTSLKKVATFIGTVLVTLGATNGIGQATTLVNFSVNSDVPNPSALPQSSLTPVPASPSPSSAPLNLTATNQIGGRYNDSSFDITSISYTLTGNDIGNYAWSSTGNLSNIFTKESVSSDGTQLVFTGGDIKPGDYFQVIRNYAPQSGAAFTPTVTVQYSAPVTSVPEPSSGLSTFAFGAFAAAWLVKRKLNG